MCSTGTPLRLSSSLSFFGALSIGIKTNNVCKMLRSVLGIQEALETLANAIPPLGYSIGCMPGTTPRAGDAKMKRQP